MTRGILASYEGTYQSKDDPDNEVRLIAKGDNLVIRQLWDKKETEVKALTDSYFYNSEQSYPLQIVMDKDGKVSQIVLLLGNVFNRVADAKK